MACTCLSTAVNASDGFFITDIKDQMNTFLGDLQTQITAESALFVETLDNVNVFLDRASCLDFLGADNLLYSTVSGVASQIQTVLSFTTGMVDTAVSSIGSLSTFLDTPLNINSPELSGYLGDAYAAIFDTSGTLGTALTKLGQVVDGASTLVNTLTCLGEPIDDALQEKIDEINGGIAEASGRLGAVTDLVSSVDSFLSGDACLDLNC